MPVRRGGRSIALDSPQHSLFLQMSPVDSRPPGCYNRVEYPEDIVNYLIARPEDEYLENVDTVFLFGAGTSAHMKLSASAGSPCVPLDTTFFQVVKEGVLEKWCNNEILGIAKLARDRVLGALRDAGVTEQDLFTQPGTECPRMRLEELFCRLEMLRMLGRSVTMRTDGQWNEWKEAWKHPSDALRDLIAIVMAHGRPTDRSGYADFAQRVVTDHGEKPTNTYAVLTLNYEIGLECAIKVLYDNNHSTFMGVRKFIQERDIHPDLGTGLMFHYALPHRPPPPTLEAVPILKLHGSCNWGFCPECMNASHLNLEVLKHGCKIGDLAGRPDKRKVCRWHTADWRLCPNYVPHIVPPTWNKWMGDPTTRHIWRQGYAILNRCRKLFLVGTSLPETDVHLGHLIRMAFGKRNRDPEVYVVNPVCENERQRYVQRVEVVLGMTVPEENCLWESFEKKETLDWMFGRVH